jgi:hypothetical protein
MEGYAVNSIVQHAARNMQRQHVGATCNKRRAADAKHRAAQRSVLDACNTRVSNAQLRGTNGCGKRFDFFRLLSVSSGEERRHRPGDSEGNTVAKAKAVTVRIRDCPARHGTVTALRCGGTALHCTVAARHGTTRHCAVAHSAKVTRCITWLLHGSARVAVHGTAPHAVMRQAYLEATEYGSAPMPLHVPLCPPAPTLFTKRLVVALDVRSSLQQHATCDKTTYSKTRCEVQQDKMRDERCNDASGSRRSTTVLQYT